MIHSERRHLAHLQIQLQVIHTPIWLGPIRFMARAVASADPGNGG